MQIIDSHCHINFPELGEDIEGILKRMEENSVTKALCVSVQLEKLDEILDLATKYPNIYASVGVHPDNENCEEPTTEQLVTVIQATLKLWLSGRLGLTTFAQKVIPSGNVNVFATHIDAAKITQKPLIIHTREAGNDTLDILREQGEEKLKASCIASQKRYPLHSLLSSWGF